MPRRLIGQRIGTLVSVITQIGRGGDGLVAAALSSSSSAAAAADDDARRSPSSGATLRRNVVHVVLGRTHPPEPLVLMAVASARVDRALRIAMQRQRTLTDIMQNICKLADYSIH